MTLEPLFIHSGMIFIDIQQPPPSRIDYKTANGAFKGCECYDTHCPLYCIISRRAGSRPQRSAAAQAARFVDAHVTQHTRYSTRTLANARSPTDVHLPVRAGLSCCVMSMLPTALAAFAHLLVLSEQAGFNRYLTVEIQFLLDWTAIISIQMYTLSQAASSPHPSLIRSLTARR